MKPGIYKIVSDGTEYEIEFKETTLRNEKGQKRTTKDFWAKLIKSECKPVPGEPFKIKGDDWDNKINKGYIVAK